MSNVPSLETKIRRGYGQGTGADYQPFHHTPEINSQGTCSVIRDWKTGREVHCLSQGEAMAYRILRWDDNNAEVYEQYPLWDKNFSNIETVAIAREFGLRHPHDNSFIMTSDFFVEERDGTRNVYSVKPDFESLSKSEIKSLFIEQTYWIRHGVGFVLLFKDKMNPILADNIRLLTEFYDAKDVFDHVSAIKHKLAIKEWEADLTQEVLTVRMLEEICSRYVNPKLKGGALS